MAELEAVVRTEQAAVRARKTHVNELSASLASMRHSHILKRRKQLLAVYQDTHSRHLVRSIIEPLLLLYLN